MCPGATGTTYQASPAGTANTEDRTRVTSSLRHSLTASRTETRAKTREFRRHDRPRRHHCIPGPSMPRALLIASRSRCSGLASTIPNVMGARRRRRRGGRT